MGSQDVFLNPASQNNQLEQLKVFTGESAKFPYCTLKWGYKGQLLTLRLPLKTQKRQSEKWNFVLLFRFICFGVKWRVLEPIPAANE